jgi:RNA polymerase sigma-70 factor (ECF subfamily)
MLAPAATGPFDELFALEYPRLVSIARRFVGADAEDVAQDVFAAFARAPVAGRTHARAWLQRATVHRALSNLRAARRRGVRERRHAVLEAAGAGGPLEPERALERLETGEAVRAALAALPPRYATVLALRAAGLTYKELAAVMDVTTNAIGTLLIRAEAALRKELSHGPSLR